MMREINCVAITGPTGAIGTALCSRLTREGIHVYAFIRPGSSRADHLRDIPGIEIMECDISELRQLSKKKSNICVDALFHLAWTNTTGPGRNDMKAQINNIKYSLDAVYTAKNLGASVYIGAGSQAEYGRVDGPLRPGTPCFPETGYGMAKLCSGQMTKLECEKYGIDHIWTRILSVYGPYESKNTMIFNLVNKLFNGEEPSLTTGDQMWDYIYADDAAEALYRMALYGKSGSIYPLGSGTARPLKEYIEMIRDKINPALPLGLGKIPYGSKQIMHLEADISALKEDTGFEPNTDFGFGIEKTIEYILSEINNID